MLRELTEDDFVRRMKKSAASGVHGLLVAELRWLQSEYWRTVAMFFNTVRWKGNAIAGQPSC